MSGTLRDDLFVPKQLVGAFGLGPMRLSPAVKIRRRTCVSAAVRRRCHAVRHSCVCGAVPRRRESEGRLVVLPLHPLLYQTATYQIVWHVPLVRRRARTG